MLNLTQQLTFIHDGANTFLCYDEGFIHLFHCIIFVRFLVLDLPDLTKSTYSYHILQIKHILDVLHLLCWNTRVMKII